MKVIRDGKEVKFNKKPKKNEMAKDYGLLMDGDILIVKKGDVWDNVCCDCGMAHRYTFSIDREGNIRIRIKGLSRVTAQIRRWAKVKISKRRA